MKSVSEINAKILRGDAVVLTAEEFKRMVRGGEEVDVEEVDVVTTATCGVMSGTAAIMVVPVAERGVFDRAEMAWLNGVPSFPGPCPNERLGVVDLVVYGTAHASHSYGGGHLFRDIVEGKPVHIRVKAGGRIFEKEVTIDEIPFARMFTTRSAFKNYAAFVNPRKGIVNTIFSVTGLKGPLKEATVSGTGEVNPLENDPDLQVIGFGTKILVNGTVGYVIGEGTRSTSDHPNISVVADMRGMVPEFMGGFVTSAGPECITSIAVPIPVINEEILEKLKVLDENVKLPVMDVHTRTTIAETTYYSVWHEASLEVRFDFKKCKECVKKTCKAEKYCPTGAFSKRGIDKRKCFNCCTCLYLCPEQDLKGWVIRVNGKEVPIVLRQSDRSKANKLSRMLKKQIEKGEFLLTEHVPLR